MKSIPHKKLKALGLWGTQVRLFARYLDGAPGKLAEFWLGSISTEGAVSKVGGRATDDWLRFVSHAGIGGAELLQFGVDSPAYGRYVSTGWISECVISELERVNFTILHASPWKQVVDNPSHLA